MMSQRRNAVAERPVTSSASAANAIGDDDILDAVLPLLLAVGPRRLTMADVARQAEVSRATLYRRWPNVRSLVGALVTREWSAVAVAARPDQPPGRERLVRTVVAIAGAIRTHPLLRMIVELDPEFLLPYLLERRGTSTDVQLRMLTGEIRAAQRTGTVRRGNAEVLAAAVQLTATAFVLSAPALAGDDRLLVRLDRELGPLIDRYLAP